MDLRPYNPTSEQLSVLKQVLGYQPFILSDSFQTGTADEWMHRSGLLQMDRNQVDKRTWRRFTAANDRMRRMYDDWIEVICHYAKPMKGCNVVDTACNSGYFLYRLLEHGVDCAVGYDLSGEFGKAFDILNAVTGLKAEFYHCAYDSILHRIPQAIAGDIVISSAIMLHLSDPTYYLAFLGKLTRRVLFLFTAVERCSDLRIRYHAEPRVFRRDQPFPVCFDGMTTISYPLLQFGLKEMGFEHIIEVPYRRTWLPRKWYRDYLALIAVKG